MFYEDMRSLWNLSQLLLNDLIFSGAATEHDLAVAVAYEEECWNRWMCFM